MKEKSKTIIISISVILLLILFLLVILYYLNIIPHKKYSNDYFNIIPYVSSIDKDNDGIDDQTDILNGARKYLDTNPIYKSRYYETGYSNDEYGVCTDVVANALLNAGYDLMNLVDTDIRNNRELYNIDIVDKNIDFRRVRNLITYFKRTAINLTTNLNQIEEWQGGDIVVFQSHIGIVSDKRNRHGVPFALHLSGSKQYTFEEDILEYRNDIVGHFRIS